MVLYKYLAVNWLKTLKLLPNPHTFLKITFNKYVNFSTDLQIFLHIKVLQQQHNLVNDNLFCL